MSELFPDIWSANASTPESFSGTRVDDIIAIMTERAKYYGAQHNRIPTSEVSLLMDALDKLRLTMSDLADDELETLVDAEVDMFHQHLGGEEDENE